MSKSVIKKTYLAEPIKQKYSSLFCNCVRRCHPASFSSSVMESRLSAGIIGGARAGDRNRPHYFLGDDEEATAVYLDVVRKLVYICFAIIIHFLFWLSPIPFTHTLNPTTLSQFIFVFCWFFSPALLFLSFNLLVYSFLVYHYSGCFFLSAHVCACLSVCTCQCVICVHLFVVSNECECVCSCVCVSART